MPLTVTDQWVTSDDDVQITVRVTSGTVCLGFENLAAVLPDGTVIAADGWLSDADVDRLLSALLAAKSRRHALAVA